MQQIRLGILEKIYLTKYPIGYAAPIARFAQSWSSVLRMVTSPEQNWDIQGVG
jgi:hypothetical protein